MAGLLAILAGITNAAAASNVAVPTIFTLIQTVRDIWPKHNPPSTEPLPTDAELVALMRQELTESHNENLADQDDLIRQIEELESNIDNGGTADAPSPFRD